MLRRYNAGPWILPGASIHYSRYPGLPEIEIGGGSSSEELRCLAVPCSQTHAWCITWTTRWSWPWGLWWHKTLRHGELAADCAVRAIRGLGLRVLWKVFRRKVAGLIRAARFVFSRLFCDSPIVPISRLSSSLSFSICITRPPVIRQLKPVTRYVGIAVTFALICLSNLYFANWKTHSWSFSMTVNRKLTIDCYWIVEKMIGDEHER